MWNPIYFMIKKSTLFTLLIWAWVTSVYAQPNSQMPDTLNVQLRPLSPELLENYKNDKDFFYYKKEDVFADLKEWLAAWYYKIISELFSGNVGDILWALAKIIIPIVTIFLAIRFFLASRISTVLHNNKKAEASINLKTITDIKQLDLDTLYKQALSSKDYRNAIRILYLKALQQLNLHKLIVWKDAKTNYDYLQELQHGAYAAEFAELTHYYENIWYGSFPINENGFLKINTLFNTFFNGLTREKTDAH